MSNLRDRLKPPVSATMAPATMPEPGTHAAVPSAVLDPTPQHAATKHNGTRREVDMVRIYYGSNGAFASVPYAYLVDVDMPEPGKLVLEFASRSVTIEGIRLEALASEIEHHRVAIIRATDSPAFDQGSREAHITRVTSKRL